MGKRLLLGMMIGAALCACAPVGPSSTAARSGELASGLQRYRCEQEIQFTVRFGDDTAVVDAGARGSELLLRDAGGLTPEQTVYSNPRLRAEFGVGAAHTGAVLHYLAPAMDIRCLREPGG